MAASHETTTDRRTAREAVESTTAPVDLTDLYDHVLNEPDPQKAADTLLGEYLTHLRAAADRGDLALIRSMVDDLDARRDEFSRAILVGSPLNPDRPHPGRTANPPEASNRP